MYFRLLVNSFKKTSLQANIFSRYMTRRGGKRKACSIGRKLNKISSNKVLICDYPPVRIPIYTHKTKKEQGQSLVLFLAGDEGFEPPDDGVRATKSEKATTIIADSILVFLITLTRRAVYAPIIFFKERALYVTRAQYI